MREPCYHQSQPLFPEYEDWLLPPPPVVDDDILPHAMDLPPLSPRHNISVTICLVSTYTSQHPSCFRTCLSSSLSSVHRQSPSFVSPGFCLLVSVFRSLLFSLSWSVLVYVTLFMSLCSWLYSVILPVILPACLYL